MSRLDVTAIAIRGNSTFATSQNAAPATTSRKATSQSAAPATKKRHACIDTLPKYCACHAKHENDLTFCDLGAPKQAFRARLPLLFILWKTGWCRSANVPPNGSELTSWRRVGDDEATTTRRRGDDEATTRQQNKANTGPTPDPNYKREPFATHSWKKICIYIYLQYINMILYNVHVYFYIHADTVLRIIGGRMGEKLRNASIREKLNFEYFKLWSAIKWTLPSSCWWTWLLSAKSAPSWLFSIWEASAEMAGVLAHHSRCFSCCFQLRYGELLYNGVQVGMFGHLNFTRL